MYMESHGIRKSEYERIDSQNMSAHFIKITSQRVQILNTNNN